MVFYPGNNNVLIVSSAANQIHALDVEVRAPGQWSRRNGARIAKKLQDFPGTIIGLSLPSHPKSTSIIAYSSRYPSLPASLHKDICFVIFFNLLLCLRIALLVPRRKFNVEIFPVLTVLGLICSAMCHIDFSQPIGDEAGPMEEESGKGPKAISNGKVHEGANSNGILVEGSSRTSSVRESKTLVTSNGSESKSLVVVNMKNPVLFLGHTGRNSVLIVEKPWLEVLRQFPAPVSRHVYGS